MWLFFTIWWDLFRVQSVKEDEKKEDGVFLFTPTCTLQYSSSANKKVCGCGAGIVYALCSCQNWTWLTGYRMPKYMWLKLLIIK